MKEYLKVLDELGMPLPPYITERLEKRKISNYSKHNGLQQLNSRITFRRITKWYKTKGIEIAFVTLHAGLGTFRPVKVDNVLHDMHSEYYIVEKSSRKNKQCKENETELFV